MNIPTLPADKATHVIAGAIVGDVAALACFLTGHPSLALWVPTVAAGIVGAAKEGVDWYLNKKAAESGQIPLHGVELNDFLATLCGGLLVSVR